MLSESPISQSIDPRILNISYSSLLTLHSCPRKFQLEKLNSISDSSESESESITFSYGSVVGEGIQCVLEGISYEDILWRMFLSWKPDILSSNPKQNKSFAHAAFAVQKFAAMREQGYLDGYSLVQYDCKPACELSFLINLPNGFKYRGFVDAVLQHDSTGKVIVLEAKTSSATTVNSATYKNSAQAVGYSIVLDVLFPSLSSYEVLYLVYSTKAYTYTTLEFTKSFVQRARWIQELVLDADLIARYDERDMYPMHGESCYSYFRECAYMNLCQMETSRLTSPIREDEIQGIEDKNSTYQINITLDDLIQSQLQKAT